ncbi:MAG TPA: bifunctional lysylphosphatidylglycerol flippase/synthetase MprF [Burkholderiaceae bacterium]|nr:bifunctional lysylphosphatidylglycerol flippase/synthetase MprF [Burkholderiaceae bacterium]
MNTYTTRVDQDRGPVATGVFIASIGHALRKAGPLIGLAVFGLSLWVLHGWLRDQQYRQLLGVISNMPAASLAWAVVLTTAGYSVLAGYDVLAMRFVGRRVATGSLAATAFVANALGNNFGNTLLTGAAVRHWTYAAVGLSTQEIARVVVFCSVGFWLGFLFVGGLVFTLDPVVLPEALHWVGKTTRPMGVAFLGVLATYFAFTVAATRYALALGTRRISLPTPALTVGQVSVASTDLCLMASVFHALLPASADISFVRCVAVFLVALVAGNVSLVPGGLGVFESTVVLLLGSRVAAVDLAAALVMFRGVYFIAPLLMAGAMLGLRATADLVPRLDRSVMLGVRGLTALVPQVLAAAVFVAGALLLFSGSTPAAAGRLDALHRVLALPLIEASHFLASLVGAALVLLAHGLQRRLDAAWHLALMLLVAGAAFSLAKGWDYEEAIVLGVAVMVLLPSRGQFRRVSSLLNEPFSASWTASVAVVLGASAWLVRFANRHALDAGQSWWDFALHAEASRSLRATVGAMALAALFALYRLMRPMRPPLPRPTLEEIERARAIVEHSPQTYANLVLRGDKAVLFSSAGDAFLMYGRHGRCWVAMGDPVGSREGSQELLWRFRDLCDRFDGWCVFFEVHQDRRADYAQIDLGLTPLGEQARVDLGRFDLDRPAHADLRQARARLQRHHCRFEFVPQDRVESIVPALAQVSDAWLAHKATEEKQFSNASFDAQYLAQFPVAVVRCDERIVAFANLWLGAGKDEMSVDLMRHLPSAPNGAMDFLFCELILWGQARGYRWFDLGMAPLSGLETRADVPLWGRIGTLLYRHGEHFYNFQGLRRYKAKFKPVWQPLYLASPGGVALPAILIDVTALMAGSLTGIVSKRGRRGERAT